VDLPCALYDAVGFAPPASSLRNVTRIPRSDIFAESHLDLDLKPYSNFHTQSAPTPEMRRGMIYMVILPSQ
jgi:hypothetical protein